MIRDDARTRQTLALVVEAATSGTLPAHVARKQLLLAARDYLELSSPEKARRAFLAIPAGAWKVPLDGEENDALDSLYLAMGTVSPETRS